MMRGAEEDRLAAQRDAGLAMFEDALDKVIGLLLLVLHRNQPRHRPAATGGEQLFRIPLRRLGDDRVGRSQNRLHAAVVLFELRDGGAGELLWELEDVVD